MAGRGPAKSGRRSRARDERRDAASFTALPDVSIEGPEIPPAPLFVVGRGEFAETLREWPPETLSWWDSWRRSPLTQVWEETDWNFLRATAVIHAEFYYGDRRVAPELRLREAKMGATGEDRLRLRMAITPPAPSTTAAPKSDEVAEKREDRRKRLERAAGE